LLLPLWFSQLRYRARRWLVEAATAEVAVMAVAMAAAISEAVVTLVDTISAAVILEAATASRMSAAAITAARDSRPTRFRNEVSRAVTALRPTTVRTLA
jgi:hypothetical protein